MIDNRSLDGGRAGRLRSGTERQRSDLGRLLAIWQRVVAGRSSYPVYRREYLHWDERLGGWRLAEIFGAATLASLCLLPVTLMVFPATLAAHAAVIEIGGLLITVPAAGLVVREIEGRTWSALRATSLSSVEIALGKLAGLARLVMGGVSNLVKARAAGSLLAVPLLALTAIGPGAFPFAGRPPAAPAIAAMALAFVAFIYQPYVIAAYAACVGLAASTIAHSAGRAVALAFLLEGLVALAIGGSLIWLPHVYNPDALFSRSLFAEQLRQIFAWIVPLGAFTLARALLVPAFLGFAIHRIGRLVE